VDAFVSATGTDAAGRAAVAFVVDFSVVPIFFADVLAAAFTGVAFFAPTAFAAGLAALLDTAFTAGFTGFAAAGFFVLLDFDADFSALLTPGLSFAATDFTAGALPAGLDLLAVAAVVFLATLVLAKLALLVFLADFVTLAFIAPRPG